MAHCKVFVGSLPLGTKPKELRHLFQNFGIVMECNIMNRCGFIHMESPLQAETAILALHGSDFKGQTIIVEPGRAKDSNPNMPAALLAIGDIDDINVPGPNSNPFHQMNPQGGGFEDQGFGAKRGGGGMRGSFNAPQRGGMLNRANMGNQFGRGGGIPNRGGNNMQQHGNFSGPMRNNPNFKPRSAPYQAGGPAGGDVPRGRGRGGNRGIPGRFEGNQRGGFNGPNRPNSRFDNGGNRPERDGGNWNNRESTQGSRPPHNARHKEDFSNADSHSEPSSHQFGGDFRGNKSNFIPPNTMGQDRRGFTLDNPQTHQQQRGGGRFQMERNGGEAGGFQGRPNANMRGGFRGSRGSNRGGFGGGGGRGGIAGGNFTGSSNPSNNYNSEFPALAPVRGRGGGFGGNRGGFNRNGPPQRQNMMPHRQQN